MKLEFFITIDTDTQEFEVVNKTTGESKTLPVQIKKVIKKKEVEKASTPQLVLSDSKYTLNSKAIELMQVEPDMRLDIKFESNGTPVIGTDQAYGTPGTGNKLTKSNTVRYSGNNNARLAEHGSIFTIEPHPINEGIFILKGDNPQVVKEHKDEAVVIPDDFDLAELIDLSEDKKEVRGLDFDLNI